VVSVDAYEKVQALLASGLADDEQDAVTQLIDMGEVDEDDPDVGEILESAS
jgi:hypothetical protein